MKKFILYVGLLTFFFEIADGSGIVVGEIGNIDAGKKEIIVNSKSGTELKIGDILEIQKERGKIILDVIFPMQTIAKCKIKGNGKISELSKGMTVYRYSKVTENKDVLATAGKAGEIKMIGNIEMVMIPEGTFIMGSDKSTDEVKPAHRVNVSAFWIGKYEVTQKEYTEIMGGNPSYFDGDNLPVEMISWTDAVEFCDKFSIKYNVKARLPYEAEWEYACRSGSETGYFWGDIINGDYCWYIGNSSHKTHPVGQKKPNAFGLYDMSGNVWEWCMDFYDADYYKNSHSKNPKGALSGSDRILRGGSWFDDDFYHFSYIRLKNLPWFRISYNGFRIVVSR